MKYYIYAVPYNSTSGGSIALHRLAHNLSTLGQEAYIVADTKNPSWEGIHIQHGDPIDPEGVSIYPEITTGNPFATRRVVRWLLNTPGVLGGDGIYEDTDLIYKFAEYFKAPDESKVKGELRALDLKLDMYTDRGEHQPGKTCYMVRKGALKALNQHPVDAIRVDDYGIKGGDTYLADMFNSCDTFISYDHANFACAHAALCGCRVIVIPDGEMSEEEWKFKFPYFSFGIAYGVDDIQWADDSRQYVRGILEMLEKETIDQTRQLIKDCESI